MVSLPPSWAPGRLFKLVPSLVMSTLGPRRVTPPSAVTVKPCWCLPFLRGALVSCGGNGSWRPCSRCRGRPLLWDGHHLWDFLGNRQRVKTEGGLEPRWPSPSHCRACDSWDLARLWLCLTVLRGQGLPPCQRGALLTAGLEQRLPGGPQPCLGFPLSLRWVFLQEGVLLTDYVPRGNGSLLSV